MTAQRRSGYASEDDYPIKCPHCLNEFTIKVADIEAGSEVRCPEKSWGKVERNACFRFGEGAKGFPRPLASHAANSPPGLKGHARMTCA